MKYIETVIIGGGPAGSAAGISLLKNGEACCIIDKQRFPRDKTCGGLLSQKTLDLLAELNPDADLSRFYINKTNHFQLRRKNKPVSTFNSKHLFYITHRKLFDNLLIEEYKKRGGLLFEEEKAVDVHFEKKIVITDKQHIQYNCLVFADGCKSLSNKLIKKKNLGITIEADIPAEHIRFDNRTLCLDLGLRKVGYGWIFPKNDCATVGFGCPFEEGKNYLDEFKNYLTYCGVAPDVPIRMRGATIPWGENNGVAAVPEANVLLVGDSAGMVDSLTGEGLYFAIKSGMLAAEAIAGKKQVPETYQASCNSIYEIISRSYKTARFFYRYRRLFLFLAPNQENRLVRFIDNELSYYNYGYNYDVRKKFLSLFFKGARCKGAGCKA